MTLLAPNNPNNLGSLNAAPGPNVLSADVRYALQQLQACPPELRAIAAALPNASRLSVSSLALNANLLLAPQTPLPAFGLLTQALALTDITPMVALNAQGSAYRANLMLQAQDVMTQQSVNLLLTPMAFYLNGAQPPSCEARPYVLLESEATLVSSLEAADAPAALRALYQNNRQAAQQWLSVPSFNVQMPTRGNAAWALADRLYPLALVRWLSAQRQLANSPLAYPTPETPPNAATADPLGDRALVDLLAVANGASVQNAVGFNYSNWLASTTQAGDRTQVLQVAQTALSVAVGLDWLRDRLTDSQKQQLIHAIATQALPLFRDSFRYYAGDCNASCLPTSGAQSWWINSPSNWNLVISGSMLTALKVLSYEVDPSLDVALAQQMQQLFAWFTQAAKAGDNPALHYGLANVLGDGSWFEGPHYWAYAHENLAALLSTYPAAALNLPANLSAGLARSLNFAQNTRNNAGHLYNFSDCPDSTGSFAALFYLARQSNNAAATAYELQLDLTYDAPQIYAYTQALSLVWLQPHHLLNPAPPRQPVTAQVFNLSQVGLFNDTTSGAHMYLGCKGGITNLAHRQEDNGSFVFDADGVRWANDLGLDSYALPDYNAGYIYYRQRSAGNNVCSVQNEYVTTAVDSPIRLLSSDANSVVTQIDLTAHMQQGIGFSANGNAPGPLAKNLRSWQRTFSLNLQPGQAMLSIGDALTLQQAATTSTPALVWNMNLPPDATTTPSAQGLQIHSAGQTLQLQYRLTHANFTSLSVEPPVSPSNPGPIPTAPGSNTYYVEGSEALPTGAQVLHLQVQPQPGSQDITVQVTLTPGSASTTPAN